MNRVVGVSTIIIPVGAALGVTAVFLLLAIYPRFVLEYPRLTETNLLYLPVDIWSISDDVSGIAIQLVLIYAICLTESFRNFVQGELQGREGIQLIAAWSGIYVFTLVLHLIPLDWFSSGLVFIILLTGYTGGWQAGLVAGVLTTFVLGTYNLIDYGGLVEEYQDNGWIAALAYWRQDFTVDYLYDQSVAVYIWIGLMGGLAAQGLGDRRWSPAFAALTAGLIVLAGGYLVAINVEDPAWETGYLAPRVLACSAGLAIVALIVNAVQTGIARQRAAAAELAQTRAELQALRAQINPHFLFNSLNTIRYFVRTDPASARRLLVDLSEVFQHALRSGEFGPLRDEIRYAQAYLALEKARLDMRLQVNWSLPDEEQLDIPVPTLILQPIVENAVIHGIAKKPEGGVLDIEIDADDGDLEFVIRDNGMGIAPARLAQLLEDSPEPGKSIGLHNINSRLVNLYGSGHQLAIQSAPGAGTTVRFQVPIDRRWGQNLVEVQARLDREMDG